MNQDTLGIQGRLIKTQILDLVKENGEVSAGAELRVYSRPLSGGEVAVALLNTHSFSFPQDISFNFNEVSEAQVDLPFP